MKMNLQCSCLVRHREPLWHRIQLNFFRASLTCPNFEIVPCLQFLLSQTLVNFKKQIQNAVQSCGLLF